jgi:hypothetical protein
MSGSEDRVQQALAAHLEHQEVGGPEPDLSHLTPAERDRLQKLIGLLDQTEGIAFGRGLDERRDEAAAATEAGQRLLAVLRDALPSATRIATDPAAGSVAIPGISVSEGLTVGTFGGRIRVWLLAGESALEEREESLRELARVFRAFPDTAAVALVDSHLSCLLVLPEDCAPNIEVPQGSLVARRYRRPIVPVGESLSVFLRETIPSWEPMRGIGEETLITVEVPPIVEERARRAIEDQVAAGVRARKTNPKRKALTALGEREAGDLAKLVLEVLEGRAQPQDVEGELRRLATRR